MNDDVRDLDFQSMEERPGGGGGALGLFAAVFLIAAIIGVAWGFYEIGLRVAANLCGGGH